MSDLTNDTNEELTGNPLMDDATAWGETETSTETPVSESQETTEEAEAVEPVKVKGQSGGKFVLVDPSAVRADHAKNGRHFTATDAEIEELRVSLLKHGQLQAAQVKRLSAKEKEATGQEYDLIFGFTRHAAASLIPGFKLKVVVVQGVNSEDSFLMNLEENRRRNSTNPVDDSYNIARLEDSFGWDSGRISEFYGFSTSKFSQVRRLKQLETPAQRRVANGLLSIAEAVKLLKMDAASVAEVLASVPEELPRPTVEEFPSDVVPTDASVESNGTGHPTESAPVKGKRGRPAKKETQEEINRKASKAYKSSRKALKRDLKKSVNKKAKEIGTSTSQRSMVELKAVLKDRDDAVSNAIKAFIANEMNASDLDAELDRVKDLVYMAEHQPA